MSSSLTFRMKESNQSYIINFKGNSIKGADVRDKVAERLKCTSREVDIFMDDQLVKDDADIRIFSTVQVVRKTIDPKELVRMLRADKMKKDAEKKVIGAAIPGGGSAALLPAGPDTSGMSAEQRKLMEMQQQIGEQSGTGPDGQMMGRGRGGGGRGRGGMPDGDDRKPPPNYVCDNCGCRGHYIQHCHLPRGFANRAKVLGLPIGIPETQLIVVTDVAEAEYRTRDGKYVKRKMNAISVGNKDSNVAEKLTAGVADDSIPEKLVCAKCRRLVKNAVRTPCCDRTICGERCLDKHIDENGPECPLCDETIMVDDIEPDAEVRGEVEAFIKKQQTGAK